MTRDHVGQNIICCRWLRKHLDDLQRGYACAIETHAVSNSSISKNNSSEELVCNRWLRVQLEHVVQGYRSAMTTNEENEDLHEAIEKFEAENEELRGQMEYIKSDSATKEEDLKRRIAELENLVRVVTASN